MSLSAGQVYLLSKEINLASLQQITASNFFLKTYKQYI